MSYAVELRPAAVRQLRGLSAQVQRRLTPHIGGLAENPRPAGVKRMIGSNNLYRVRVGDYRIIYAIDDAAQRVTVTTIGHRRDVSR